MGATELENDAGEPDAAYRTGDELGVWAGNAIGMRARTERIAGRRRFMKSFLMEKAEARYEAIADPMFPTGAPFSSGVLRRMR